jgi:hypothetical protein
MKHTLDSMSQASTATVTERLLQFITDKGISRNAFYTKTGIGNGSLDKKGGMNTQSIEKVLEVYPDLNLYWLITGKGERTINPAKSERTKERIEDAPIELLDVYRKLDLLRDKLQETEEELNVERQESRMKDAKISEQLREIINLRQELASKASENIA